MKQKSELDLLNEAIIETEGRQAYEFKLLKEQFNLAAENLKPVNLIKNSLHDVISSPELKHDILSKAVGLATGYLSKKILVGSSHNPIKKLLGIFLQFSISNIVEKKADNFVTRNENTVVL